MDDTLFWTKVAAIGQIAGAIATFLAVLVALLLARAERALRVRVKANFGLVVTVAGNVPVMTYEVENIGLRPVVVHGLWWTTGFINRLGWIPKALRLRSIFQQPDYEWPINPQFPWRLEPGESKSTHIRKADFISSLSEPNPYGIYRRFPWQRNPTLFHFRVGVGVATLGRIVRGKVDPKITAALNAAYQGQHETPP